MSPCRLCAVAYSSSEEKRRRVVTESEILRPGTVVDQFVVQHLHATAGYSCVYYAVDVITGQSVALKVLHEKLAELPRHVERFRREYEALHSIRHPNVVEILDYGLLDDRRPYLVMEWCAGATLEGLLTRGAFTIEEAMPIFRQLIFAVQEVHSVGVIHRDIKPANILLLPSAGGAPLVKLIDFGIATPADSSEAERTSLTSTGACLGTPYSMAPEQIFGLPLDERTDVYAVGVLAYEVLTGQKPFHGASVAEVVDMHLHLPPPRVSDVAPAPPALDRVIQRCMAKEAEDRYPTVKSVFVALEEAASHTTTAVSGAGLRDAVGVHVDLDFRRPEDEVEDEDFDLIDDILEHAHEACTAAGLRVALETGNGFLAVGLMPDAPVRRRALRSAAVGFAQEVARRYRGLSSESVSLSVMVHVGQVKAEICDGVTSFVGGDLLSLSEWSTVEDDALVIASALAVRSLDVDSEQVPDRPGYLRLT